MHSKFTSQEMAHYARHFNLPEIGIEGQLRLKQARVLYIGAGGLGSAALPYLTAAGVGTIGMIDPDVVEASNLQRQTLYSYADIGKQKVLCALSRLQQLNPAITINIYAEKLTEKNALEIISQYDIIADGSDNFATRYLVNDACFHLNKPHVYAAISQFSGQCTVFTAQNGPCYRCLFDTPPPPDLMPNCAEGGVLGVLPALIGSIQATEVIKLITNIGKPLINRLLLINALDMSFREIAIFQNPHCRLCHDHEAFDTLPRYEEIACHHSVKNFPDELSVFELKNLLQTQSDILLLDVREPFEFQICHLNGTLIPLNTLSNNLSNLDANRHIVVYCKSGVRSMRAVKFLKANGFNQVSNLKGGIIEWINQIDPTMTRY
ncbi:MAG: hypothetical protein ACD_46C00502G0002 [uncultured bacterium]|nr:MAG: hypothetical protein ACD_46C00502G0002 [uncultured bacterium]